MSIPPGRGAEFWTFVLDLATHLDQRSYYELLGVAQGADADTITRAYYERVKRLHPDRHVRESEERQRALTRLYARIGEAFRKLTDSDARRAYDSALESGAVRLGRELEAQAKRRVNERDPRTPKARALYQRGRELLDQGDARGAGAQWRLAIQFEPDSKVLRAALDEIATASNRASARPARGSAAPADTAPRSVLARSSGAAQRPTPAPRSFATRVADPAEYPGLCAEIAQALEASPRDHRLRALWYAALARLAMRESRTLDATLHRQTALAFDPECPGLDGI